MQPITLTDEQRQFREVLRQFSEDKIAPRAAETDHLARYDWDAFHALVAMELPALGLPVEYGGAGADLVTQAIAAEELARVCASTSLMLLISKLSTLPIMNFGTEELKRTYLPRVASGESQGSYCLSEADAGSDVASMSTRAVRDGDSYVLNGTKIWITNAGISDIYVVFAKTDPEGGPSRHLGVRGGEGLGCAGHEARREDGHQGKPHRTAPLRRGPSARRRT